MGYNSAALTITNESTPDPFVVHAHGKYYLTFTSGCEVQIWRADNLLTIGTSCTKTVVWRPPPDTHFSSGIWAPELHQIGGRWYIYVACENPLEGNKSHRMYVLGGPPSLTDPCSDGPWQFLGSLQGMPPWQWAIDGTVVHINGADYFVYSGWPQDNPDLSDRVQCLFITQMAGPMDVVGDPICICQPTEWWERPEHDRGINEGPQWLVSPDRTWQGIVYSCHGSWTRDYKMNTLRYIGGDPLHSSSWYKSRTPLLQARGLGQGAPYGPGHGSFIRTPGGETWTIYHGTDREDEGWNNRKARVQRLVWTPTGPDMNGVVGHLVSNETAFLAPAEKEGIEEYIGQGEGGDAGTVSVVEDVDVVTMPMERRGTMTKEEAEEQESLSRNWSWELIMIMTNTITARDQG